MPPGVQTVSHAGLGLRDPALRPPQPPAHPRKLGNDPPGNLGYRPDPCSLPKRQSHVSRYVLVLVEARTWRATLGIRGNPGIHRITHRPTHSREPPEPAVGSVTTRYRQHRSRPRRATLNPQQPHRRPTAPAGLLRADLLAGRAYCDRIRARGTPATTPRCASCPTVSSASSTAASRPEPSTTNIGPGTNVRSKWRPDPSRPRTAAAEERTQEHQTITSGAERLPGGTVTPAG